MTKLPQSFYVEQVRRRENSRAHIWLAGLLALVSGWLLFRLPGAPLHVLVLPPDVQNFGAGLADMFIDTDGTWIIKRQHYVDRMNRYEIDPQGNLHKWRGAMRAERNPEMEGGRQTKDEVMMVEGHQVRVRPSKQYRTELQNYRKSHAKVPQHNEKAQVTPEQLAIEAELKRTGMKEPYVIAIVYGPNEIQAHFILQGQTYYEILDSTAFYQPDLWITTDKAKYLHRVKATDVGGKVVIKVLKTVPLQLDAPLEFDSKLGLDERKHLLYLLLPTGDVYWFDPQSLAQRGHDKLGGNWEREYAEFGSAYGTDVYPGYPDNSGWALTERGYKRLMRLLAVTFIASLIWLGLEILRAWRSTSERTTAATS